jgi:phosphoglycerol transferase
MIFTTDNTLGENRRFGSTLDVGVTILPYIGFDGEIGLGRDLQSNEYNEGEIKYIHNNLKKWSPMFESFWDFPKLENDLSINVSTSTLGKENYVRIDNREFEIPVMVEFSKSLQTNLIFKYKKSDLINIDEEYSVFKNRINKNKNNDSVFISADLCSEVRNIYKDLPDDGICYLIGRGDKIIEGNSIFGKMNFTSDDVKEYFNK